MIAGGARTRIRLTLVLDRGPLSDARAGKHRPHPPTRSLPRPRTKQRSPRFNQEAHTITSSQAPPTPTTHTTLAHHTHHAGTQHAQQCIATTSSILKSTHHIGRQLHLLHQGDAQAPKGHLLVVPRGKVQRTAAETRLDLAPPGGMCTCVRVRMRA